MSHELNDTSSHRLDDYFNNINKKYEDYCTKKQSGFNCTKIKSDIMKLIYEMYNQTKYKFLISELGLEICQRVVACLSTYETYDKKDTVSFSKFIWHDITNFVILPKKASLENSLNEQDEYFKEGIKRKIYKLNKFINLYQQERYKKPNFSDKTVMHWFMEQLSWSEKQLKRIIEYCEFKTVYIYKDQNGNDKNQNEDNKSTLLDIIENTNSVDPYLIVSLRSTIQIYQNVWSSEQKGITKQRISSLYTWWFLTRLSSKEHYIVSEEFLKEFDIFDKQILTRYFNGQWQNDTFDQKDIAKMLDMDTGQASKTLSSFLQNVKEYYLQESI